MAVNYRLAKTYKSSTAVLTTLVAGSVVSGTAVSLLGSPGVAPMSLSANVTTALTTSLITMAPRWEVSQDGATWMPLVAANNAANVAGAAGTGALVTTSYALMLPTCVAYPYARLSLVTGGATGAAGDSYIISYNFLRPDVG